MRRQSGKPEKIDWLRMQQLQQQLVAPPRHLSGSHPAPTAVTTGRTVHFAPETVTPLATTREPLTGMSATWTVGGGGEGGGGEVSGSLLVESSSGDTAGGGEQGPAVYTDIEFEGC